MLIDLMKQLTKIKKKHGDVPMMYMYGEASELSLANLTKACLVYTDLEIDGKAFVYSQNIKHENFVTEKDFDAEKHSNFKPVVLITEKL